MKFIVDAQLPKSLSDLLRRHGHDSLHTLDLPHQNRTTDREIIKIAEEEERIVVTKNWDFVEFFLLKGKPEKLIMIKTGNSTNPYLLRLVESNLKTIIKLISRSKLVEVGKSEITEHG